MNTIDQAKQVIESTSARSDSGSVVSASPRPKLTFAEVLVAVADAEGLTDGVRSNLHGAVTKVAGIMSKAGLGQILDPEAVANRLGKLSAAKLGFKTANSRAAFISNFWRAVRLAGVDVLPGRHLTPLSPAWDDLYALLPELKAQLRLSRFFHFSTEQSWLPEEIGDEHIHRYREELRRTCARSKADKLARYVVRGWNAAAETIQGWPQRRLEAGFNADRFYILPWSAFPGSYRDDVEAFLASDADTWLQGDTARRSLKPRTKSNYRDAYRRAASILVRLGVAAESIRTLADVVHLDRVEAVLCFLRDRTERRQGGHVALMALLLLVAADVHVGADDKVVEKLTEYFESVRERGQTMSPRTQERLAQFDDPALLDRLERLPSDLIKAVKGKPVDQATAGRVRLALFMAILWDTGLRSGNVVALDLDRHLVPTDPADKGRVVLHIPAGEVKNGVEFRGPLQPSTVRFWNLYLNNYRHIHAGSPCSWLFPRPDGSHWPQQGAYQALNDLCDRTLGADVTPHLIRALVGKVMLEFNPGAALVVQQLLGHKSIQTTIAHYSFIKSSKAREIYFDVLRRRRGQGGPDEI